MYAGFINQSAVWSRLTLFRTRRPDQNDGCVARIQACKRLHVEEGRADVAAVLPVDAGRRQRTQLGFAPGACSDMDLPSVRECCCGEMAERLKAHAWKACVRASVPRVRIPVSPPSQRPPKNRRNPPFSRWRK